MSTRTVHDPFLGKDVQVSDRLTDRLRGKYACGPAMENGEPEFGWRQHEAPPIQHEAADHIEALEAALMAEWAARDNRIEALEAAHEQDTRLIKRVHYRHKTGRRPHRGASRGWLCLREIKDQYLTPDQSSAIAKAALAPEQDKP